MTARLCSTISRHYPLSAQRSFLDAEWEALHGSGHIPVDKGSKDRLVMNQTAIIGKLVGSKRRVYCAHKPTFTGIA